ncbi:MAG TPA: MOSC domain-containing protein [Chloroflexota bacterium]|jgi:MOSC domain-containing protein YiiM|nr:MOSC domain-containing protein [Chloroflexota bacterium]
MRSQPGPPPRATAAGTVRLLSVNVSPPRELGRIVSGGRDVAVLSGIAKRPVAAGSLSLDWENLEGDGQADLRVHGGRDKAVYAYPADHWPAWSEEEGRDFGPASFGENLTVAGITEGAVCIGDVWAWGEARLQVSQPRGPCFKLEMHTGRPGMIERMRANGRTGWYFRVLQPGRVPVAGPLRVVERHPAGVSVLRAHLATVPGGMSDAERRAILRETPLAAAWQRPIRGRLAAD